MATKWSVRSLSVSIVGAIAVCCVTSAFAQDANMEEIIVSATKRVESIKEVPVSVVVVTGEQMKNLNIIDIKDASAFIPNFEFSNDPILPNLYIRGVGSGVSQIIEQSIGTFIDGVYMGRATTSSLQFMDIKSFEVLRGTQGTLFGKNTVAGALVVSTNDPTQEFSGGADLTFGGYSTTGNYHQINAHLSGGLSDNVAGRVAIRYRDADGYVENSLDGPDGAARKDFAIRTKLLWSANDSTDVSLKLEYSEYETDGQISSEILGFDRNRNPGQYDAYLIAAPEFEDTLNWQGHLSCNVPATMFFCPGRDQDYQNATLTIDHDFDFARLTSISGYQSYDYVDRFHSVDVGVLGGVFQATRDESYDGFSQEIRLTSEASGVEIFDYLVGVYFESVELERLQGDHFNIPVLTSTFLGPPGVGPFFDRHEDWTLDTTTAAVFGEFRWKLSDTVRLTLGGRYGSEEKEFDFIRLIDQYYSNVNIATTDFPPATRDENKFTPSASFRWQPADDLNLYYKYAEGHKTGGFSDRLGSTPENIEFSAETSVSHEIGLKAVLLNDKLDLNVALFTMALDDLQVARVGTAAECGAPGAFCFIVQNAAEVTSQGLELDWRLFATDALTLGGAYAYTDATYDQFTEAGCPIGVGGLCDISGQTLIFAPEHKGNIYASYGQQLGNDWGFMGLINLAFSSEFYGSQELDEEVRQGSYSLLNASVQFTSPDGRLALSLIGRNLTEEPVLSFGIPVPGGQPYAFGSSAPPREIAARVSYSFD